MLYHEAADALSSPTNAGGSLKARIFANKTASTGSSSPAQIYALVIESCKWSKLLSEVIENANLLALERKLTPILAVLLVHDLLLAKKGIALPATHGLRTAVEKHKARLQAEFTKARIRRKIGSVEALKLYINSGQEDEARQSNQYYRPRWVRINSLKTTLEAQLESTFKDFEQVQDVQELKQWGKRQLCVDVHVPNLVAVSQSTDLTKSEAYKSGLIIFQDKASCFPACLLNTVPDDGDVIDACAAPGNKTTHVAAILQAQVADNADLKRTIHAFEKNAVRAQTLDKMVKLAGSGEFTEIHASHDFLKVDPSAAIYSNVGALLLDPSCSGSGIVGRDDIPSLILPSASGKAPSTSSKSSKGASKKRKRDASEPEKEKVELLVDDDGEVEEVDSEDKLQLRLEALSKFQLEIILHAFKFPAARKVSYSTCSIYAEENEKVVLQALQSSVAWERSWRLLLRGEQVKGMREWPVRGSIEASESREDVAEACIRAAKDDKHGTMGFFLACFVRDSSFESGKVIPAEAKSTERIDTNSSHTGEKEITSEHLDGREDAASDEGNGEEWNGFDDENEDENDAHKTTADETAELSGPDDQKRQRRKLTPLDNPKNRTSLLVGQKNKSGKKRKGKQSNGKQAK